MMGASTGNVDGPAVATETAEQRARRLGWLEDDRYDSELMHDDYGRLEYGPISAQWWHLESGHVVDRYDTLAAALDAIHGDDDANR